MDARSRPCPIASVRRPANFRSRSASSASVCGAGGQPFQRAYSAGRHTAQGRNPAATASASVAKKTRLAT
ncbi:hypothetical protein B4N89_01460 [Embleya scabrispora]|uniref:Uncharacterized protein n=1 Tax=Embleya scabrispora TaxID=159449 RepID=A0A1T3NSJ1_9ACTN|nr:hypothetical protein B4N89_01460 [Embleya scabrispora]